MGRNKLSTHDRPTESFSSYNLLSISFLEFSCVIVVPSGCTKCRGNLLCRVPILKAFVWLFSRFGDGYTVTLRIGGENTDLEAVSEFIKSLFPAAVLKVFFNIITRTVILDYNSLFNMCCCFYFRVARLSSEHYTPTT